MISLALLLGDANVTNRISPFGDVKHRVAHSPSNLFSTCPQPFASTIARSPQNMMSAFIPPVTLRLRTRAACVKRAKCAPTLMTASSDDRRAKRVPPSDFGESATAPVTNDDVDTEFDAASEPVVAPEEVSKVSVQEGIPKKGKKSLGDDIVIEPEVVSELEAQEEIETQLESTIEQEMVVSDNKAKEPYFPLSDAEPEAASEPVTASKDVSNEQKPTVSEEATRSKKDKDDSKAEASGGVQLSAEEVVAAQKRKEAADEATRKADEAASARREKIFGNVQRVVSLVGSKTGVVALGERARTSLEARLDAVLDEPVKDDEASQDKLTRTAAAAFRSLSGALFVQWESNVVPLLREKVLPKETEQLDARALAAATLGVFVAVALLPSLFGSGDGQMATMKEKKALDTDTAALQLKLADEKAQRLLERRTRTGEKLFPNTDPVPEALQPSAPPATRTPVPEVAKPTPAPPAPVVPQPEQKREVTTGDMLAAVRKSLGARSSLITSATFDSLTASPTVILEARPEFARLGQPEQRALALAALQSARSLGYETLTITESGSDIEVARAGIDVILSDEAGTLRVQLAAMQAQAERLAADNADASAKIDALNTLALEERAQYARRVQEAQASLEALRAEKAELLEELADAEREVASVPDRQTLETRTLGAEARAAEMAAAVDTLSRQVTVARDAQSAAVAAAEVARSEAIVAQTAQADAIAATEKRVETAKAELEGERVQIMQNAELRISDGVQSANDERDVALKAVQNEHVQTERLLAAAAMQLEQETGKLRVEAENAAKDADMRLAAETMRLERITSDVRAEAEKAAAEADKKLAVETARLEQVMATVRAEAEKVAVEADKRLLTETGILEREKAKIEANAEQVAVNADKRLSMVTAKLERINAETKAEAEKMMVMKNKEREAALASAEKSFMVRLDDVKKEAQAKLDAAMRDSDARMKTLREETRASINASERRTRDVEKAAKADSDRLVNEVRTISKERDDARRALERVKARESGETGTTSET